MGFRDFISNFSFRKRLERKFEEFQNIQPPANPSPKYIDKLVHKLLKPNHAWDAQKELDMMGPLAVPALTAALNDKRFHLAKWDEGIPAPFDATLELLVPHAPDTVLLHALPRVNDPSDRVRKTAAIHIASLAHIDTVPVLEKLLNDPDGYVRTYVCMGLLRAAKANRFTPEFRQKCYEILFPQCAQEWLKINNAAQALIALDPSRAVADFCDPNYLAPQHPEIHSILEACNEAKLQLPENTLRLLLDQHLPLTENVKHPYPHDYIVAEAITALAFILGNRAQPTLEKALNSSHEKVYIAAVEALARNAGITNPVTFVLDHLKSAGFANLTPPQKNFYLAWLYDAEVNNGGLLQFFGNTSGNLAVETLDALRTLNLHQSAAILESAMKLVGPLARQPDRDLRLAAFEDRFDELQAAFNSLRPPPGPPEIPLQKQIYLYALENPSHFRLAPTLSPK